MKQASILTVFLAAALVGCHHAADTVYTGPNGSSVTISDNGAHYEATAQDGSKVSETVSSGGVTVKDNKGDSLETGAGNISENDLGLPFYPGSQVNAAGSMLTNSPTEKSVVSSRSTSDDPDKVIAFYKDKITGAGSSNSSSGGQVVDTVSGKLADGSDATVIVTKMGSKDAIIQVSVTHKVSG